MFQVRQPLRTLSDNESKSGITPFLVFDDSKSSLMKPPKFSKKAQPTKLDPESAKKMYCGIIKMQNLMICKLQKKFAFLSLLLRCNTQKQHATKTKAAAEEEATLRVSPLKKSIVTPKKRRYDDSGEALPHADVNYGSPPRSRGQSIPSTPPSGPPSMTPSSHGKLKAKRGGIISSQLHSFESPQRPNNQPHSPSHLETAFDRNPGNNREAASDKLPFPSKHSESSDVSSLEARLQVLENSIRLISLTPVALPFPGQTEGNVSGKQATIANMNVSEDESQPPPQPNTSRNSQQSENKLGSNQTSVKVDPSQSVHIATSNDKMPSSLASTGSASTSLFAPSKTIWKPLQSEFAAFREAMDEARLASRSSRSDSIKKEDVFANWKDKLPYAKDSSSTSLRSAQSYPQQSSIHSPNAGIVGTSSNSTPVVALSDLTLLQNKISTWKQQYAVSSDTNSNQPSRTNNLR